MTPGARVAAAIEILDEILTGTAAEAVLTKWARNNRFAGSKDRAAIRDHVYDALRQLRSAAALGGSMSGRGIMLGSLAGVNADLARIFTGTGYDALPLTQAERNRLTKAPALSDAERANLPDWIWPYWTKSLGNSAHEIAQILQVRAPITLRVNLARSTRNDAAAGLLQAGIATVENPLSQTALTVISGARQIRGSRWYRDGLIELQDAASQAVADRIDMDCNTAVLDYCAGGGGKALTFAARGAAVTAHDSSSKRMRDLSLRAKRAQTPIRIAEPGTLDSTERFDVVVCDVPCSGSGTWRRTPDAKWSLTERNLIDLVQTQRAICKSALRYSKPGGLFAYVTCSVLNDESTANSDWISDMFPLIQVDRLQLRPDANGDGFFMSLFRT